MSEPISEAELAAIQAALTQGRKIEAIKLHRKATGSGLAEAKNAVEKMEVELGLASPAASENKPSAGGCFGLLLFVGVMLTAVLAWLAGK